MQSFLERSDALIRVHAQLHAFPEGARGLARATMLRHVSELISDGEGLVNALYNGVISRGGSTSFGPHSASDGDDCCDDSLREQKERLPSTWLPSEADSAQEYIAKLSSVVNVVRVSVGGAQMLEKVDYELAFLAWVEVIEVLHRFLSNDVDAPVALHSMVKASVKYSMLKYCYFAARCAQKALESRTRSAPPPQPDSNSTGGLEAPTGKEPCYWRHHFAGALSSTNALIKSAWASLECEKLSAAERARQRMLEAAQRGVEAAANLLAQNWRKHFVSELQRTNRSFASMNSTPFYSDDSTHHRNNFISYLWSSNTLFKPSRSSTVRSSLSNGQSWSSYSYPAARSPASLCGCVVTIQLLEFGVPFTVSNGRLSRPNGLELFKTFKVHGRKVGKRAVLGFQEVDSEAFLFCCPSGQHFLHGYASGRSVYCKYKMFSHGEEFALTPVPCGGSPSSDSQPAFRVRSCATGRYWLYDDTHKVMSTTDSFDRASDIVFRVVLPKAGDGCSPSDGSLGDPKQ